MKTLWVKAKLFYEVEEIARLRGITTVQLIEESIKLKLLSMNKSRLS